MSVVLKPCPFCGKQPTMSDYSSCDDLYVHLVCSCEVAPRSHGVAAEFAWERDRGRYRCRTREEAYDYASKRAIERWNTRVEPPALVECDACPRSSGCVETCMKAKVCEHDWTEESAANGWRSKCRLCGKEAAGSGQ